MPVTATEPDRIVTDVHPDLAAEQSYIDRAYRLLEATRASARKMESLVEVGRGGTEQARYEREVIYEQMAQRLDRLDLAEHQALCFGRIDPVPDNGDEEAAYYIGRVAVFDDDQNPTIIDWRAPISEAFYRATGPEPMGLLRRRSFISRGRTLLAIEDELFGEAAEALNDVPVVEGRRSINGQGALIAALETSRTGKLGDIVGTIQAEQDEIIRADQHGVLVVQGGPGTGKTVVALHRAAYLLYTHRFPLERQGVLVIGPNRLFLNYIDQVLPSLGEAGVELAVLADLVPDVRVAGFDRGAVARAKGDLKMVQVISRAVRDRERPLRRDLVVPYGLTSLRCTAETSERIVQDARRRYRTHNAARRHVEHELFAALAASARAEIDPGEVRHRVRGELVVREALEWMWPVLTPSQLLHDLFGSRALLAHAGAGLLTSDEIDALNRDRSDDVTQVVWRDDDVPLLDEARELLGARPGRREDEVRTYGHIVVDEAQDLSPMQLRVLTRRSLSGSMTVVGDIAQATGAWAHADWQEVLDQLPDRYVPRVAELTVGYRTPGPIMALAARVLVEAAPGLRPPTSIRETGDLPSIRHTGEAGIGRAVVDAVRAELEAVGAGSIGVLCPVSLEDAVSEALGAAGIEHGHATRHGLDQQVTVIPVPLAKGLELNAVVVVEPAAIVDEEPQGMRSLYVAMTRATQRLALVHERPMPAVLQDA
jgi:DNA helicase IV